MIHFIQHILTFRMIFVALIALITTTSFNQTKKISSNRDDILGTYLTPNKKSKIKFIKRNDLYYGILSWNVNPEIKDKYNLKQEARNKNLIGQDIFKDLKYNPYERVWIGNFYDTESGITYSCKLWLENAKKNLMARGYIETPLIGRTETLKRVDP